MRPALAHGDVLLVSSVEEGEELGRGDVVVVREPAGRAGEYLKRIVGLPVEAVGIVDGQLFVNGNHTREPYLGGLPSSVGWGLERRYGSWAGRASEYLVMGDNRAHSTDAVGRSRVRVFHLLESQEPSFPSL